MNPNARIFSTLPGEWTFSRESPDQAVMTGEAIFKPSGPDLLHYREEGRVLFGNAQPIRAYREYEYRLKADAIAVHYHDPLEGRKLLADFHFSPVDAEPAEVLQARGIHHCGSDIYDFRYSFQNADAFTTDCRVAGPRKDFRIFTSFARTT